MLEGGRVRCEPCSPGQQEYVKERLVSRGVNAEEVGRCMTVMRRAPVIGSERLLSAIDLLGCVSERIILEAEHIVGRDTRSAAPAVARAKAYIREHFLEHLTVASIARHSHVSEGHLMKVFKRQTGQTLVQFTNRLRIDEAKRRLVNADQQIAQVAFDCGFESVPYFNRVFRRFAGISPGAFRKGGELVVE